MIASAIVESTVPIGIEMHLSHWNASLSFLEQANEMSAWRWGHSTDHWTTALHCSDAAGCYSLWSAWHHLARKWTVPNRLEITFVGESYCPYSVRRLRSTAGGTLHFDAKFSPKISTNSNYVPNDAYWAIYKHLPFIFNLSIYQNKWFQDVLSNPYVWQTTHLV